MLSYNITIIIICIMCYLSSAAVINMQQVQPQKQLSNNLHRSMKKQEKPLTQSTNNSSRQKLKQVYTKHTEVYGKIPANRHSKQNYDDVMLYHRIPDIFVVGEMFIIEGQVIQSILMQYLIKTQQQQQKNNKSTNIKEYILNIVLINIDTDKKTVIQHSIPIQKRKFRQQLVFQNVGIFRIGIGLSQYTIVPTKLYNVVAQSTFIYDLGQIQPASVIPSNIQVRFNDNQLYIRWIPQTNVSKIRIFQQQSHKIITQQKVYIVSNDKGQLKVPFRDFKNFQQKQLTIQLSHAQSMDTSSYFRYTSYSNIQSKKINITKHHYMERRLDLLYFRYEELELMKTVGDIFVLQGISYDNIIDKAVIVMPNNTISQVLLVENHQKNPDTNILPAYSQFSFKFTLQLEGVYILQINHQQGFAVLNIPIYVGVRYPLIPDQVDLYQCYSCQNIQDNQKQLDQQTHKKIILQQINRTRNKFGVSILKQDKSLSKLAQIHSKDMIKRDYVSHQNLQKQGPKARAIKAQIYTPIGQNIIAERNINLLQMKLNRSPLHLKNTIDKRWTRVGLSLIKNKDDKRYYLTEQFSCDEFKPSEQDIIKIQNQIIQVFKQMIKENITQNENLSLQLSKYDELQEKVRLKQILKQLGIKSASFFRTQIQIGSKYIEELKQSQSIGNIKKKKFGLGVKFQKGSYQVIGVFY